MIGWSEVVVIFLVVLLLFGSKRIPEIARSLGRASREFKNARDEIVTEAQKSVDKDEDKKDGDQDKKA